jgi:hypothetical protein
MEVFREGVNLCYSCGIAGIFFLFFWERMKNAVLEKNNIYIDIYRGGVTGVICV